MSVVALVGKQAQSAELATARFNVWEGAVRSSKTVSSILKWLEYVRTGPPGALLMAGKTERTLKRNIIDPIEAMVGKQRCVFKIGLGEVDLLGRTIYVAGANNEASQDKIKGLTLAGAYGDEITTWPESFYQMLGTRLSVPNAKFFGTTNPAAKTHWLMKNYLKRSQLHLDINGKLSVDTSPEALNLNRFSFQLKDNPTLTREYVEALEKDYVGLFYKRYILGEWCLAEGAVFDMFDPDKHVVDVLPRIVHWLCVAIDHGTINPTHAVLIGLGEDGRLYVTNEWRYDSRQENRQLSDVEQSARLREWLQTVPIPGTQVQGVAPQFFIIDPAAANLRIQMHRDGIASTAGDNSVLDGIRSVSSLLALDQLRIHSSCKYLLEELPSYCWDQKAADKGEDSPLKTDDHGVDALRYGIYTTRGMWQGQLGFPS